MSSEIEGLPNVMLEAMYLGKPVAVTQSIPFITQTVKEGVNGYTCPIHDFEAFASCMLQSAKIKKLPLYNDVTGSAHKICNFFDSIL